MHQIAPFFNLKKSLSSPPPPKSWLWPCLDGELLIFQTQEGDRIEVYFEDRFDLYCVYPDTHPICYHWVEIRYQQNPGMHGPRYSRLNNYSRTKV